MKFYGQPNMLIRINNLKPYKSIRFNGNGEYETENTRLIARLKNRFKHEEPNAVVEETKEIEETKENIIASTVYRCKKCDFETENKGLLLAHYREHKKE